MPCPTPNAQVLHVWGPCTPRARGWDVSFPVPLPLVVGWVGEVTGRPRWAVHGGVHAPAPRGSAGMLCWLRPALAIRVPRVVPA